MQSSLCEKIRFSMHCPAGVCSIQSTAPDASKTITALLVLLAPGERYRVACQRAHACAGALATLPTSVALQLPESPLTDSPTATFRPSPLELSDCDAGRRVHFESESSLTCSEHTFTFMLTTCQARQSPGNGDGTLTRVATSLNSIFARTFTCPTFECEVFPGVGCHPRRRETQSSRTSMYFLTAVSVTLPTVAAK